MRAVIQRVKYCEVIIDDRVHSKIDKGLLVLLGIEDVDDQSDIDWLSSKIANMRLFDDSGGVMNLSARDISAEILLVSQFTLFASTKKGNRPSYIRASKPEIAIPLYERMKIAISTLLGKEIKTGVFGADMKVHLVNDGPVTIVVDSKEKE